MRATFLPPPVTTPEQQRLTVSTGAFGASQDKPTRPGSSFASGNPDTPMEGPPQVENIPVEYVRHADQTNMPVSIPPHPPIPVYRPNFTESHTVPELAPRMPEVAPSSLPAASRPSSRLPTPASHDPFVYRRQELNLSQQDDHASDIVPDSQPAESDVVPSSCRTEDAVPSSGG